MKLYNKNIALFILTIMSLSFVIFFYGDILKSPNDYMFSYVGDALKNYANFKYHLEYDESLFTYNGVFYPYGESLFFTDIHPAIVTFYKLLSYIFPSIGYYSVGLINTQILLSIVLTSIVLFFVFIKLKVSEFTSVFGAFSITVLSSHILLLEYGHWALSYAWAAPLAWVLLINFLEKERKILWSIIIAINTLFWFFTHGYQGLSTLLFTASVFLFLFTKNIKNVNYLTKMLKYFVIQIIVPVILYYVVVTFSDNHASRIDMPFVTNYISDINFVISPNNSFFKPLFYSIYNFSIPELSWGVIGNYIGISSIIVIVIFVFRFLKLKHLLEQSNFFIYILASILVLLYSFGIPFKYNLEYLLDYIPAIRQFTGLGRFAWIFYFVITVFSFFIIDKSIKNKYLRYSLVLLSAFVMTLEGSSYHYKISEFIHKPNVLKKENIASVYKELTNVDVSKYQAVITLPFFIKYGNPYVPSFTHKSGYLYSIIPSYTGLPTLNAVLSRPSVDEGRKITQIFSPNQYKKDIKNDFKSDKPFLILYTKEKLAKQEQIFLDKCKLLKSTEKYELYEIDFNTIFEYDSDIIVDEFNNIKGSYYKIDKWFLSDTSYFYYNNFDNLDTDTILLGTGSLSKNKLDSNLILKLDCHELELEKEYNLSFWYFNTGFNQAFTTIKLMEFNKSSNKNDKVYTTNPLHSEIINSMWNYVEFNFRITNKNNVLKLNNESGKLFSDNKIYIDNILIRESDVNVFSQLSDSLIIKNNHIFTY